MANVAIPATVRPDGSLYVDITPQTLGLAVLTPLCRLPIDYGEQTWAALGLSAKAEGRATCPVDTGFLRDHIDYANDKGGVEIWSEATYSVYQEYGTSRMRAQPYFESSVTVGIGDVIDDMEATETLWMNADQALFEVQQLVSSISSGMISFGLARQTIQEARSCLAAIQAVGIDVSELLDALDQTEDEIDEMEIEYMMMQQMQQQMGLGGGILEWILTLLAQLVIATLSALISNIFEGIFATNAEAIPHSPSH